MRTTHLGSGMYFKMATSFNPGGHSPTSLSRTLEKVFDEAQHTGELNLSGRKLKEYPKVANKYDLTDTSCADLSKNRLCDVPREVCDFRSLERLDAYHNIIRALPHALIQLQALVHLNLSRNQLTTLPTFLAELPALEVLHAANNKLVSLPEEIGKLERLMDLDVSCNEITQLPMQMGALESLRSLNVRRNLLVELPVDISKLQLTRLDFSGNRISHIPCEYRNISTLREFHLQHNPLVCPPANICTKGLVHILKFLHTAALREDRRRGVIMSEVELRRHPRKTGPLHQPTPDEYRHLDSPNERRKRHTVDSGYSTTDSNEKSRWSPSECELMGLSALRYTLQRLGQSGSLLSVTSDLEEANVLALKAAEVVKEHRQEREAHYSKRHQTPSLQSTPYSTPSQQSTPYSTPPAPTSSHPTPTSASASSPEPTSPLVLLPGGTTTRDQSTLSPATTPSPLRQVSLPNSVGSGDISRSSVSSMEHSPVGPGQHSPHITPSGSSSTAITPPTLRPPGKTTPSSAETPPDNCYVSQVDLVDEFTRELHRQKSEYEARKQKAAQLRREQEQEEEREERRRIAVRLVESQKKVMEDSRRPPNDTTLMRPRRLTVDNCYSGTNGKLASPTYPNYGDPTDASPTGVNQNHSNLPHHPAGLTHSHSLRTVRPRHYEESLRRLGHSNSFRGDEKPAYANNNNYRKSRSDSSFTDPDPSPSPQGQDNYNQWRNNGVHEVSPNASSSPKLDQQNKYINNHHSPDEEFRVRHEAMILRQRQEAARVQRCLDEDKLRMQMSPEEEKQRMKQIQKDAVLSYFSKRAQLSRTASVADEEEFSFSRDSTPNTSFNSSTMPSTLRGKTPIPAGVARGLEEMSAELSSMNPSFTIRRQYVQAQEEYDMIDNLRRNIESRLKVTLPDDLPAALKDGVVLCHLANHIRPRSVSSIHVPSPAVPKLTTAKCRRNVENFLEACRRFGVEQEQLCGASAVLEEKALVSIATTVQALLTCAGVPPAPIMSTV